MLWWYANQIWTNMKRLKMMLNGLYEFRSVCGSPFLPPPPSFPLFLLSHSLLFCFSLLFLFCFYWASETEWSWLQSLVHAKLLLICTIQFLASLFFYSLHLFPLVITNFFLPYSPTLMHLIGVLWCVCILKKCALFCKCMCF